MTGVSRMEERHHSLGDRVETKALVYARYHCLVLVGRADHCCLARCLFC